MHSNRKLTTGTRLCSSYLDVCVFSDRNSITVKQWIILFLCLVPWPLPSVCYFCLFGSCFFSLVNTNCLCGLVLSPVFWSVCVYSRGHSIYIYFEISHYSKLILLFQTSPSNKPLYFCTYALQHTVYYVPRQCFSFGVRDFNVQISCVLCSSWKSLDACLLIIPLNPPLSQ